MNTEIKALINKPFAEAVSFFRGKTALKADDFKKLKEKYQHLGFMISNLNKLDQAQILHGGLLKALEEGESFGSWKKNNTNILEQAGFGKVKNHRLKTIYQNNLQTSYSAGRWEQLQQTKKTFGLLEYVAVKDAKTTLADLAQNGKIYPIDHPFWGKWYPPNHFGCRCGVIARNSDELKQKDLKVETKMSNFTPPDGWGRNAGQDAANYLAEIEINKLTHVNAKLAQSYIQSKNFRDVSFQSFIQGQAKNLTELRPVALLPIEISKRLTKIKTKSKTAEGINNQIVLMSGETAKKQFKKHADITLGHYLNPLQETLNGIVINDKANHLAIYKKIGGQWYKAVVKKTDKGEILLITYHKEKAEIALRNIAEK